MASFCPECGADAEGMRFCASCGAPLDGAPVQPPATKKLSDKEQAAILDREIAALAKQGWHTYGRPTPFEVSLRRKSGLTARQFLTLWVEEDGSLWTNQFGVMEGGRLRDLPILLTDPYAQRDIIPVPWTPTSASTPSPPGTAPGSGGAFRKSKRSWRSR